MKSTVKKDLAGNRSVPLLTVLVLVAVVATIAAFVYVSRIEGHGEQYFSRVSEQQVLGQKIAKYALEASAGDTTSFERLRVSRDRFITLMNDLKTGDPEDGLPATPEAMAEPLRDVENRWLALRAHVDEILLNQSSILSIREFVDVINTMLDETLPLTVIEWEEWGNPKEKEFFDYMQSYSPYDNVRAQGYPAMLITAGLNDPRVGYWEPAKWAAKLRATKTDDNLLLLKTNMGAGHGGASGRYDYLKEIAFEYAFILEQLGRL